LVTPLVDESADSPLTKLLDHDGPVGTLAPAPCSSANATTRSAAAVVVTETAVVLVPPVPETVEELDVSKGAADSPEYSHAVMQKWKVPDVSDTVMVDSVPSDTL
jgi:hypothetical protein